MIMWETLKQFGHDMIHMTEGEKLIYYWPLWLSIVSICGIWQLFAAKRRR